MAKRALKPRKSSDVSEKKTQNPPKVHIGHFAEKTSAEKVDVHRYTRSPAKFERNPTVRFRDRQKSTYTSAGTYWILLNNSLAGSPPPRLDPNADQNGLDHPVEAPVKITRWRSLEKHL